MRSPLCALVWNVNLYLSTAPQEPHEANGKRRSFGEQLEVGADKSDGLSVVSSVRPEQWVEIAPMRARRMEAGTSESGMPGCRRWAGGGGKLRRDPQGWQSGGGGGSGKVARFFEALCCQSAGSGRLEVF